MLEMTQEELVSVDEACAILMVSKVLYMDCLEVAY